MLGPLSCYLCTDATKVHIQDIPTLLVTVPFMRKVCLFVRGIVVNESQKQLIYAQRFVVSGRDRHLGIPNPEGFQS